MVSFCIVYQVTSHCSNWVISHSEQDWNIWIFSTFIFCRFRMSGNTGAETPASQAFIQVETIKLSFGAPPLQGEANKVQPAKLHWNGNFACPGDQVELWSQANVPIFPPCRAWTVRPPNVMTMLGSSGILISWHYQLFHSSNLQKWLSIFENEPRSTKSQLKHKCLLKLYTIYKTAHWAEENTLWNCTVDIKVFFDTLDHKAFCIIFKSKCCLCKWQSWWLWQMSSQR